MRCKGTKFCAPTISMFKNVLITGNPGVGKTTVIKNVIPLIPHSPFNKGGLRGIVGGFFTEEIRGSASREGFAVETLDGQKGTLAHVHFKSPDPSTAWVPRVGKYGVDVQSFEKIAIPAIESAIKDKELIVIDEIGKMELFSERFKEAVIKALDSNKPVLGVIPLTPPLIKGERGIFDKGGLRGVTGKFINAIKARRDVKIFTITYANRNTIPTEIAHFFENLSF